jgi:hypothetical protein
MGGMTVYQLALANPSLIESVVLIAPALLHNLPSFVPTLTNLFARKLQSILKFYLPLLIDRIEIKKLFTCLKKDIFLEIQNCGRIFYFSIRSLKG